MNWKRFKKLSENEKKDESYFILGIDLGSDSSTLAYFDISRNMPELIDISGGYGKPSVPTVMQYIPENKEWVFGEYAVLNKGFGSLTLSYLIDRLGMKEYVEIDNKPVTIHYILSLYLKELLGNVKNINPKAEIAGIVAAVPAYMSEEAKDELLMAFKNAGYEKEVIELAADRECILSHYYYGRTPMEGGTTVMLLDYGSRQLRGGLYSTDRKENHITLESLSFIFDESLGTKCVNEEVTELFTKYYKEETGDERIEFQMREQLSAFVYQHKDLLFQKNSFLKPLKLYFNFVYPPFQKNILRPDLEQLISPYKTELRSFVLKILSQASDQSEALPSEEPTAQLTQDIFPVRALESIICTGGGFEMLWAKRVIENIFPDNKIVFYKNSKGILAEGACILAASRLGITEMLEFKTEDRHQLTIDLGLKVLRDKREKFIPIAERNSFWWQKHKAKKIIINEETDKEMELELFQRNAEGDVKLLQALKLTGLPKRPKGATGLSVELSFQNYNELKATVTDMGFGELFPAEAYKREFKISL